MLTRHHVSIHKFTLTGLAYVATISAYNREEAWSDARRAYPQEKGFQLREAAAAPVQERDDGL